MANKQEQMFSSVIEEALLSEEHIEVNDVLSFESAGVLSNNTGLVVTLPDGSEFQVTIVQSS